MKHTVFLLIILLSILSCGSSKKVIQKFEPVIETKVEAKKVSKIETENLKDTVVKVNNVPLKQNTKIENESLTYQHEIKRPEDTLHFLFNELLQKHVTQNGDVNYKSFKNSHNQLLSYIKVLQMAYPKLDSLSPNKEQKLAYWINTYNALTIDLILRNYPLNSIKDINKPWDQRLWKFGDRWLNLNDIEHKILRKMNEPRIHFAIVCASKSCPKLQNFAFNAKNLETQLTQATKAFVADSTKNQISKNEIKLSKIFKWFAKDFKQNGSLIDFLNQYSAVKISPKSKKSYTAYDWSLNE